MIQFPIIQFQHILCLLVGFGIANVSSRMQLFDTGREIVVESSLPGGVEKGVFKLIQRPVDAFQFETFDNLTGADLEFGQECVVGFTLFVFGLLFGPFQITQDDELFAGLIPILGQDVEIESNVFA